MSNPGNNPGRSTPPRSLELQDSSCLEFLPWSPSRTDCNFEAKQALSSPSCFGQYITGTESKLSRMVISFHLSSSLSSVNQLVLESAVLLVSRWLSLCRHVAIEWSLFCTDPYAPILTALSQNSNMVQLTSKPLTRETI